MAKLFTLKITICLFFLATTFFALNSARLLDEVDPQPQSLDSQPGPAIPTVTTAVPDTNLIPGETPVVGAPVAAAVAAMPIATTPATADAGASADDDEEDADPPAPESTEVPVAVSASAPAAGADITEENPEQPQPEAVIPTEPVVGAPVAGGGTAAAANPVGKEPSLSFFMHDIIGGSQPSARVVAGIIASTDVTGLPFSKINNNLFPIIGGIPLVNPKLNGIVTNNNLPLLVGLNAAQSSTVFQNRGTSNSVTGGDNQPFVSAGNLPDGFTLQKLMFGSVTVIDDQLTEGHELDSTVIGRAQGFYLASSLDGTSQTIMLTVILHSGEQHHEVEDTISFFGVHRGASPGSEIAVIGGTGKYENAKGYAALEKLPNEDQHTTDGVDTILHFNVYLTE